MLRGENSELLTTPSSGRFSLIAIAIAYVNCKAFYKDRRGSNWWNRNDLHFSQEPSSVPVIPWSKYFCNLVCTHHFYVRCFMFSLYCLIYTSCVNRNSLYQIWANSECAFMKKFTSLEQVIIPLQYYKYENRPRNVLIILWFRSAFGFKLFLSFQKILNARS